jgi:hypothetical protein
LKAKQFSIVCRAKNYVPGKEGQSTKVAAAVIELQRLLPMARAVYCSATGVSEVGHMAYMERMGLWGTGSPFPDFEAFLDIMRHRGVSFLEMLAMELKSEGKYVARGLSFRAAEFLHQPCKLSDSQVSSYLLGKSIALGNCVDVRFHSPYRMSNQMMGI